jgi:hypothetical protein
VAALLLLLVGLFAPRAAEAQALPLCSWPLETSVDSLLNVAYPDTNASYWTMPIDTAHWSGMVITGTFPAARFMSLTSYDAHGAAVEGLLDYQIRPDAGGNNPFNPDESGAPALDSGSYTVIVRQTAEASGANSHRRLVRGEIFLPFITKGPLLAATPNFLSLSGDRLGWIIYRIYVPNNGENQQGGVDLPAVTLVAHDGSQLALSPCTKRDLSSLADNGYSNVIAAITQILADAEETGGNESVTCAPDEVAFAIPKVTGGYFPNPANKYIAAPDLCYQSDRVVVVSGKAAGFPDTYNGAPVWQPADQFSQIDLRYWSLCNNNQQKPYPVVQCAADWQTGIDEQGYYTYIAAETEGGKQPTWLPAGVTWLPWGSKTANNILILRNMIPSSNFHQAVQDALVAGCVFDNSNPPVPYDAIAAASDCAQSIMGAYHPRAVYCDKALLIAQGWEACFAAAGVPLP